MMGVQKVLTDERQIPTRLRRPAKAQIQFAVCRNNRIGADARVTKKEVEGQVAREIDR